jgi:hypothetical protein
MASGVTTGAGIGASPDVTPGHRLFARYAYAPNALGYCGPDGADALRQVASGKDVDADVPALARRFSGAWPYQQVLAELVGVADPLDEAVVRAYWTGNDLTDQVDRTAFGTALLERIKLQAGRYWSHLDEALLVEAAPTHAFHVLAVYPWSRLLGAGAPEPLQVLDSCRIGWATVVAVEADELVVRARHLEYDSKTLSLGGEREERIGYRVQGASFLASVAPDDRVAVHWGVACDLLTPDQAERLEWWTRWQLEAVAPRLAAG